MITEPKEIQCAIESYYQTLYKKTKDWRPELLIQDVPVISPEDQSWLQRNFEEEEILEGIKAIDKAPGPNGFPMCFFFLGHGQGRYYQGHQSAL